MNAWTSCSCPVYSHLIRISCYDKCFRGSRQKFAQVELVFYNPFLLWPFTRDSTASVGVTNRRAVYRSQQDSMGARGKRKFHFLDSCCVPIACRSRAWSSKLYHYMCQEQNCCALSCHPTELASTFHNISWSKRWKHPSKTDDCQKTVESYVGLVA